MTPLTTVGPQLDVKNKRNIIFINFFNIKLGHVEHCDKYTEILKDPPWQ